MIVWSPPVNASGKPIVSVRVVNPVNVNSFIQSRSPGDDRGFFVSVLWGIHGREAGCPTSSD
jgi:hypothetical protein